MIRLLKGTVHECEERAIILFVNGVGYHVLVPKELLGMENEVVLHIHTHVREDQLTLYGFRTKKELNFFELLLTINGIGPKMALEILNEPADIIQNAIFTGNLNTLTKIPGVGKKIAERIVLELKNKVEPTDSQSSTQQTKEKEFSNDLINALENLGYKRHHIQKVLSEMDEDLIDDEAIIRYFLQRV